ncbi:MAG: hypothetical protein IPM34_02450 [Saprospiraceae bacterium]|nr:hypothetical protein [Saprospiraceae bacterium]
MNPIRLGILFFCLLLLCYFGLSTVSPKIRKSSGERIKDLEATGVENLIQAQMKKLNEVQKAELNVLNTKFSNVSTGADSIEVYKEISGYWFRQGAHSIAGSYARQVASLEKTAESWKIAGTTFLYGLESETDPKQKLFCQQMAVSSFDQALSLDPDEAEYEMYKALAFVKLPGNEPMKGIRMMLDLEKKVPEYLPLQIQLAELGMQTGQFEKAESRLKKVLKADPVHQKTNCLMVDLLNQTHRTQEIEKYIIHCKQ